MKVFYFGEEYLTKYIKTNKILKRVLYNRK